MSSSELTSPKKTIRKDGLIAWELPGGVLHRLDGPALYDKDNFFEEWYQNGKLHRLDGPAKIRRTNSTYQEWFFNGKTHRSDGPAIYFSDGRVAYAIHGIHMSLREFSNTYLITHLQEYNEHPAGAETVAPGGFSKP